MTYLNVMPLGDSITRGHGDPAVNGYRYDLQQRLTTRGLSPNFVGPWRDGSMGDNNHAGVAGARIDQLSVSAPQLMKDYAPDVVILMAGANDIGQRYQLDTAVTRLSDMVYRLRLARPSMRLFVCAVTQFADPVNDPYVATFNADAEAMVTGLGSGWVHWIGGTSQVGDAADELADHVHPSPLGYARLSWHIWRGLSASPLNTTGAPWPAGTEPTTAEVSLRA